jgi:hypothetical protein
MSEIQIDTTERRLHITTIKYIFNNIEYAWRKKNAPGCHPKRLHGRQ